MTIFNGYSLKNIFYSCVVWNLCECVVNSKIENSEDIMYKGICSVRREKKR